MLRASMRGAILLVEGEMDVRLYRKFALPSPHTRAILCSGKPKLYEAMRILGTRRVAGILGICDADFDRILGLPSPGNIVAADHHDAEMMITHSDAMHSVLGELMSADLSLDESIVVRDSLVGASAVIGRVRLWNKGTDAKLDFKMVDAGSYLGADLKFDSGRYCERLLEMSKASKADVGSLLDASTNYHSQANPSELAVGHDFVALLDAYVAARESKSRIGAAIVGSMLRLAFDATHFRKTTLSSAITTWEDSSGFEVLAEDARP